MQSDIAENTDLPVNKLDYEYAANRAVDYSLPLLHLVVRSTSCLLKSVITELIVMTELRVVGLGLRHHVIKSMSFIQTCLPRQSCVFTAQQGSPGWSD